MPSLCSACVGSNRTDLSYGAPGGALRGNGPAPLFFPILVAHCVICLTQSVEADTETGSAVILTI